MSCDLKDDLRRFLHWGPITLLGLTLVVTWTVIDMNAMWWTPGESPGSVVNYSLIWFHTFGTLYHFVKALGAVVRGLGRRWLIKQGLYHMATVHLTPSNLMACVLSLGVTTGTGLASIKLLYMQLKVILRNQTEIESWIVKKAAFRRNAYPGNRIRPFVFPYNLGWKANCREVFLASGDGISWPVLPGCDQYTITREQLEQKKDKRARTRSYRCIRPATGNWVPIISQGLWTSLNIPCTDDPRIVLQPDDLVQVTRIQDYWLYGERVRSEEENKKGSRRKDAIRGWFPSCCVLEIPNEESEKEEDNDETELMDQKSKKTFKEIASQNKRMLDLVSPQGKPRKRLRVQ
ncbi:LOW QUALITY PROTEIN: palmitoyltransferase ZDHHC6 [Drosophila elegans]|uniref:LOW QUALITY PROTEIN: palmitoyltransferase ZDHHC6 n=1 Tax=Drosophila elegans TaxID=30023 RepID=UPI001BC85F0A|nr:LOW QUALITY PROTEIN: palmitoyltransferase ZDHHC6 [Drosophila elegans]